MKTGEWEAGRKKCVDLVSERVLRRLYRVLVVRDFFVLELLLGEYSILVGREHDTFGRDAAVVLNAILTLPPLSVGKLTRQSGGQREKAERCALDILCQAPVTALLQVLQYLPWDG